MFFVGAGFSAPMKYPLGASLPSELIFRLRGEGPEGEDNSLRKRATGVAACNRLLEDLDSYLEMFFRVPNASKQVTRKQPLDVDLADFYSVAHALSETPRLFLPKARGGVSDAEAGRLISIYQRIAAATRTYFLDINLGNSELPEDVDSIINAIRPEKDAIVSFNWDEEIDVNLTNRCDESDVVYTYESWRKSSQFLVLKPHGSINWYDVSQGVNNDDLYFVSENDPRIRQDERRIVAFLELELPKKIGSRRSHRPLECAPVITPPTFAKRFNFLEQRCVWQDVVKVCQDASEFVFLGYRIPRDDYLTRAALRAALARNRSRHLKLLVVDLNPESPEIEDSIGKVFGPGFDCQRNTLRHQFGRGGKAFAGTLLDKLRDGGLPGRTGA